MAKTTTISVRMDSSLKSEAEKVLSTLGLTPSQAINVFYKQITFQNGIPFSIKIPRNSLNETSVKAMEESDLDEYEKPIDLYKELDI